MPRYLRWITAGTTALIMQYVLFVLAAALLIGKDATQIDVRSPELLAAQLLGTFLPIIAALWINDWLAARYPLPPKGERKAAPGPPPSGP